MPVLSNARHERFCQALAAGKTEIQAYTDAGYKPNPPHASRLVRNGNIKARLTELQERGAKRTEVTIETLTAMYLADRTLARDNMQAAAAIAAVTGIAKLHGMIIDKKEVRVDKRDATDWSRAELVAFLNNADAGGEGASKANGRSGEPDSVH